MNSIKQFSFSAEHELLRRIQQLLEKKQTFGNQPNCILDLEQFSLTQAVNFLQYLEHPKLRELAEKNILLYCLSSGKDMTYSLSSDEIH